MNTAMPIFVVGIERSGTKWLSNILCNHPDVVGVQSNEHCGIIETNMLGHMELKFNFSFEDDFVAMLELWSMTDFFQATQIDKQLFLELQPRPTGCIGLFHVLMNEFASKKKSPFWLQKCNPDSALAVVRHFPDAHFVVIRRNIFDNLKSTLQDFRNRGEQLSLIVATYSYVCHEKQLMHILKQAHTIELTYEDLVDNTDTEARRICKSLGLEYDSEMVNVPYRKNTSFRNASDRQSVLRRYHKILIMFYAMCFRLLPLPILQFASRLKHVFRPKQTDAFIPGTFGSLSRKNLPKVDPEQLDRSIAV